MARAGAVAVRRRLDQQVFELLTELAPGGHRLVGRDHRGGRDGEGMPLSG